MTYKAQTPVQRTFTVLKAGEYPFRVLDAVEKKSNAGNDMIELKLAVGNDAENEATIFDYLVFDEKSQWKIDHFMKACGMHPGEGVEIDINPTEFIAWEGRCKVKVEKYNGNDQNKIAAYVWDSEGF